MPRERRLVFSPLRQGGWGGFVIVLVRGLARLKALVGANRSALELHIK